MIIEINELPIYYEIHGEGFPLVCIHGFSVDHHLMKGCIEPIFENRKGWQRIYIDLPGMGKTPGSDWINCTDDMLDLVLEVIFQLLPGQSFSIAGESYGGYLAQGIIARHPKQLEGMLLICPLTEADFSKQNNPNQKVLIEDKLFLSTLTDEDRIGFQSVAVVQTPVTWVRTLKEVNIGIKAHDKAFLDKLFTPGNYAYRSNIYPLAATFEKPSLILLGKQDHFVGYQDTWKVLENFPRASLAVLDRAGHNLQIEQPTLFNALVHEWLDRVEEVLS